MAFEYPYVPMGELVEVSNDPSRSDRILGFVIAAKHECVDVFFISPDGYGVKRNCWHEGDPRCSEHPGHFESNASGVFSLTEGALQRQELVRRLDALDASLATVAADVASLMAPKEAPSPVRRGPGRPRKHNRELVSETA